MRISNCLKIKHFITMAFTLVSTVNCFAQYDSKTAIANKVKTLRQTPDSPMEVVYEDGRIAQVLRRETTDSFKVPIVLTENSCQVPTGLKCKLIIPFIRQQYTAVWKTHPSRQGQPLIYSFDKNITYGNQVAITRSQNELYDTVLNRIQSAGEREKAAAAMSYKSLGRIECEQDLKSVMPDAREILFWEEEYENGNSELAMTEGPIFGARVNLIYRRYQNLGINAQGSVLHFNRFKKAYGMQSNDYPIGLSYRIQMYFRAPNLLDPNDELCKLKWDINFSEYFIQISALHAVAAREPYNPTGFSIYKYSLENTTQDSERVHKKELWEHEGMQ